MEKVDLRSESKLCALSRNWFKSFSSIMMLSFKLFFEEICQSDFKWIFNQFRSPDHFDQQNLICCA